MDENQLHTFFAIFETKSFSKAANMLNVTQPTITSRIKSLENIIGFKLFERKGHDIFLTKEGNLFLNYAKNILIYMEHSKAVSNLIKEPRYKIGFSHGYSVSFITEMLETIKTIDDIDVQVIEGFDSVSLNNGALSGDIDLIFTREVLSGHPDFESERLFDNRLVCVMPSNHRLCNKENIHAIDLTGETIISYSRNSHLWHLIDERLVDAKRVSRIDLPNNDMLLEAVAKGIGIGITPKLGVNKELKNKISIKNIKEVSSIENDVYVQYKKHSNKEHITKRIIYSIINHNYNNYF